MGLIKSEFFLKQPIDEASIPSCHEMHIALLHDITSLCFASSDDGDWPDDLLTTIQLRSRKLLDPSISDLLQH